LKINEWIELMKDLQYLESNVYKPLITYQDCTEIFLSSLLGSRNLENIRLASNWLQDIYICDKKSAVDLTVKAAQDYFNASSNYNDPDMEFAKECLNLVKELIQQETNKMNAPNQNSKNNFEIEVHSLNDNNNPLILKCIQIVECEQDLIMAMKLIGEFEYNILPVQVRLNTNRLEIIKDILRIKLNSYNESEKLLILADLLRIPNPLNINNNEVSSSSVCSFNQKNNNNNPQVMLLIAEQAKIVSNLTVVSNM
jgi:hypothetical protein